MLSAGPQSDTAGAVIGWRGHAQSSRKNMLAHKTKQKDQNPGGAGGSAVTDTTTHFICISQKFWNIFFKFVFACLHTMMSFCRTWEWSGEA